MIIKNRKGGGGALVYFFKVVVGRVANEIIMYIGTLYLCILNALSQLFSNFSLVWQFLNTYLLSLYVYCEREKSYLLLFVDW